MWTTLWWRNTLLVAGSLVPRLFITDSDVKIRPKEKPVDEASGRQVGRACTFIFTGDKQGD